MNKAIAVDEYHQGAAAQAYRSQVHTMRNEILASDEARDLKQAENRANACDYRRANVADESDHTAIPLTKSHAEQIIDRVADATGISKEELAEKLASYWAKTPGV